MVNTKYGNEIQLSHDPFFKLKIIVILFSSYITDLKKTLYVSFNYSHKESFPSMNFECNSANIVFVISLHVFDSFYKLSAIKNLILVLSLAVCAQVFVSLPGEKVASCIVTVCNFSKTYRF